MSMSRMRKQLFLSSCLALIITVVAACPGVCAKSDKKERMLETELQAQLMAFAEQRILSETPNVFICVSSFNPDAQRLYQRLGYEVIGELRDYIVAGHSEILLRKSIAPLNDFGRAEEP